MKGLRLVQKLRGSMPWFLVRLYKATLALLLSTCRFQVRGLDTFVQTAQKGKCALILWHDNLGLAAALLKKFAPDLEYTAVVSNSKDGRVLARLATSYPQCDALLVAHNARDVALKGMVSALQEGKRVLIVTPDGPRGPKYKLKPGVAVAAVHAGASVVPFSWRASRCWRLPSWDRMAFPKPFSRIEVTFGEANTFDGTIPLERAVEKLEESLNGKIH